MIHTHGGGRRPKGIRRHWKGALLAATVFGVALFSVMKGGWLALAPFGLAAVILLFLLAFMRAMDHVRK
ncbi:MAG TPA: hypothetical protein VJ123_02705 [Anaerolineales bacterium]|nr:hypothetical protein [Anaerolineales bacterium]